MDGCASTRAASGAPLPARRCRVRHLRDTEPHPSAAGYALARPARLPAVFLHVGSLRFPGSVNRLTDLHPGHVGPSWAGTRRVSCAAVPEALRAPSCPGDGGGVGVPFASAAPPPAPPRSTPSRPRAVPTSPSGSRSTTPGTGWRPAARDSSGGAQHARARGPAAHRHLRGGPGDRAASDLRALPTQIIRRFAHAVCDFGIE